jgi:hypothetical protein
VFPGEFPVPFLSRSSPLFLAQAVFFAVLGLSPAARSAEQPPIHLLTKANALPVAIDSDFQFRKTKTYFLESPELTGIKEDTTDEEQSIAFERKHLLYGAITGSDIRDRYGNYYTFFWRARRQADLTIRLEYRQQKTGAFVQAREVDYPGVKGSQVTRFAINGDDYQEQGRVTAWRVLLIEQHQVIVALAQSYLWR